MGWTYWASPMIQPGTNYSFYEPLLSSSVLPTLMSFRAYCSECWINKWPAIARTQDLSWYARDLEKNSQVTITLSHDDQVGITTKSRNELVAR